MKLVLMTIVLKALFLQSLLQISIQSNGVVSMSQATVPSLSQPGDMNLCKTCYDFGLQAMDGLWMVVLHDLHGQPATCEKICADLMNRTQGNNTALMCNFFCYYVGSKAFIKAIEGSADNALYFCEELEFCPISDKGDAKITNLTVHPKKGPKGTNFIIDLEYITRNGTGSGLIFLLIGTVDNVLAGDVLLNEMKTPGTYGNKITVKAVPDPTCNPKKTPGGCEKWLPGNYSVDIFLCNGGCNGASDPHQKIYARGKSNFTIIP